VGCENNVLEKHYYDHDQYCGTIRNGSDAAVNGNEKGPTGRPPSIAKTPFG